MNTKMMGNRSGKALLIVVALALLAGAIVQAQRGDDPATLQEPKYDLSWWTVDGGGGTSSGGRFAVNGTAGQPDAGTVSGGPFTLSGGFWGDEGPVEPSDRYTAYLAVVLKSSVHASYFEGPWESEDNDSYVQANAILVSGRDYFGYPDDAKDYFGIYVHTSPNITVDLNDHTGRGVQLHLFYQSVDNRVAYALAPPYRIEHTGPAGWYYIYIYTASGYNNTTPYTLRVTYP